MKLRDECSSCHKPIYSHQCTPMPKTGRRANRMYKELHLIDTIMFNCGNTKEDGAPCGSSQILQKGNK